MSRITSFLLGGLVGAGLAMLYTPKDGEQTRALLADRANAIWSEAQDLGVDAPGIARDVYNSAREKGEELLKDAPGTLQDFAKTAQEKGQELVKEAQARTSDFVGGVTSRPAGEDAQSAPETTEDLREKIESARQRIAAQVMENAEAAKAVEVPTAESEGQEG